MFAMNKALLFSVFIFPGSGYFFLKKPFHGAISALMVLAVLAVFVKEALYKSQLISQGIIDGEIALELAVIRNAILTTPGNIEPATLSLLTYAVIAVWLFGIIDCFRLSRKIAAPSN